MNETPTTTRRRGALWGMLLGLLLVPTALVLMGANDASNLIGAIVQAVDPTDYAAGERRAIGITTAGHLKVRIASSDAAATDTELPAAAALADNAANPTTPMVGANQLLWDGVTWDRWPGNSAAGGRVQGAGADGAAAVGDPVQAAGVDAGGLTQALRTDAVGNLRVDPTGTTAQPVTDNGGSLTVDSAQLPAALVGGRLDVVVGAALPAGANTIGDVTVTELPAAVALGDAAANSTTTTVGASILFFNGATVDRARGDVANGLDVDVTRMPADATELPAAAALADNAANPTAPAVGAHLLAFDGATWDRLLNGAGTEAGALRVTLPTDGTGVVNIAELPAAVALGDAAANATTTTVGASLLVFNGATVDRLRGDVANGLDVDVTRMPADATELPAAAALADAAANPTAPAVGAFSLLFNGATWDRVRGDTANGVDVDVTRMPADATELPAAVALADAAANPTAPAVGAFNLVFNGATWDRATGNVANGLDVDVTRLNDGGNVISVDGLTAVGVAAVDLAKREDDVHASLDAGVAAWAVRRDTATSTAADGDYHPLLVNSVGALRTQLDGVAVVTSEFVAIAADIQGVAAATGLRLQSVTLRETAGAVASFAFRHGTVATDPTITFVSLAANESKTVTAPAGGWLAPNGVFIDRISGTADVNLGTLTRSP